MATSLGAVRSIPSYNVMGLARAGLEANVRFLAADLGPEGICVNGIGNAAAFLCSDLAAGITGEILYVDGGFNTVGMSFPQQSEG